MCVRWMENENRRHMDYYKDNNLSMKRVFKPNEARTIKFDKDNEMLIILLLRYTMYERKGDRGSK
jgi:hypothetical protein